jgi:hypothetical protein
MAMTSGHRGSLRRAPEASRPTPTRHDKPGPRAALRDLRAEGVAETLAWLQKASTQKNGDA